MTEASGAQLSGDRPIDARRNEGDDGREHLSWQEFGRGALELARSIHDDGYQPDIILSIARGGMFVAAQLAYALGVKNLHLINVEYYTGEGTRKEFPVLLPPPLSMVDLSDRRLLVADDVTDTGHTLALVEKVSRESVAEVRTAVLYQKPSSVVSCDYVWRRTDRWIVFPWSKDPPLGEGSPEQA
jgi:hypoxanthine phosphoribosyltransferase